MKRFRFPLRPVAILRAHHEVRAQEAFAVAVQRHALAREQFRQVGIRMRTLETTLAARRETNFRGAEAALLLADYRQECAAESEAERLVAEAQKGVEQARAAYVIAHRDLEVVKRLEAKSREVHRRDGIRTEQAEMDELAGQRRTPSFSFSP